MSVGSVEPEVPQLTRLPDILSILPLKRMVVFPYVIVPISITRETSAAAVDQALSEDRLILLLTQRDETVEEPGADDLYEIGTVGSVMRMLRLPDGRIRVLVQGIERVRVERLNRTQPFLQARVSSLAAPEPEEREALEATALLRGVQQGLEKAVELGKTISSDVMVLAANLDDPGRLADLAASNLELPTGEAQEVLEMVAPLERLERVGQLLEREIELLSMQHHISNQAREEIDRSQREYFLRQQLRTIQEELGEADDLSGEVQLFRERARDREMDGEALEELERQLRRLERTHPDSAESSVLRTYLDWLTGLPWAITSEDNLDLEHARTVLDEDHFDLEHVKERILEFLAVRKLKADAPGPILCFVGPPGVGKTSLGRSIARALGREFVRLALGGISDEAEIRGHRRTYVGALPGRILQGIHRAGTSNPVFMLDEIDKLGRDFRGDPSSALLEALDPEQNNSFRDHYLGVEYDLSRVLFIATANLLEPIQPAFRDRLEIIRLSGYTFDQKLEIARRHLIPKQLEANGLDEEALPLTDGALRRILEEYTKEAGVRNLEREIGSVCRKVAVRVARELPNYKRIDASLARRMLGPPKHFAEELLDRDRVGVATGLAWTESGGDILLVEASTVPGKGRLQLTGQLGDVMKESAQAALSFTRGHLARAGVAANYFSRHDIHIHVPAGAIPKDGPSAGVTIAVALVSLLTDRAVDHRVAMTGELTLRGEVLPVGGLREKVLAALAAGVRQVMIPKANVRDLVKIPEPMRRRIDLVPIAHVEEALDRALRPPA